METKYFGEFRDVCSKASDDVYSKALTDMYSKAVREMYLQFKQREDHLLKKYIGRSVSFSGEKVDVVGYYADMSNVTRLIIDASQIGGWTALEPFDVVFKECESYWYVRIDDLID